MLVPGPKNGIRGIVLLPLFPNGQDLLQFLQTQLRGTFGVEVTIRPPGPLPERAFVSRRNQYQAEAILASLPADGTTLLLALTDRDLFVPGLNFVFGLAQPGRQRAIISLARLRQEFYGLPENRVLFFERSLKEAVHELGHLLGLGHCSNPLCVMHFSNRLQDTDRKQAEFCKRCKRNLPSP